MLQGHSGPFPSSPPPYLQVRHPLLKGLRVVPQEPLLLQELGVPSISGRLEEAVVVGVPQGLVEGEDDLLLGAPHRAVLVKLETPLRDTQRAQGRVEVRGRDVLMFLSSMPALEAEIIMINGL